MIENFTETKSWRKNLEKLKQNVDIFIEIKNIFSTKNNNNNNNNLMNTKFIQSSISTNFASVSC